MKPFEQQTYYELLEVPVTASVSEIRDAHSRMLEQYSPDSIAIYALVEPEQLDALRARLTEAMEILTEPDLRLEYDRTVGVVRPEGAVSPLPAPVVKPAEEDVPELELSVVQNVVQSVEPVRPVEVAPVAPVAEAVPEPTRQEAPVVAPVVAAKEPVREVVEPATPGIPVAAVPVGRPPFQGYMFSAPLKAEAPAEAPPPAPVTVPVSVAPAGPAPSAPAVEPVAVAPVSVPVAVTPPSTPAAPVKERPTAVASGARPGSASRGAVPSVPPPLPPRSALRTPVQAAAQRAAAAAAAASQSSVAPPAPPEPVATEQGPVSSAPESALAIAPKPRESRTRLKSVDLSPDTEFTGEVLRRVREQRGFTLAQLAERTRISTRHLENVEADQYGGLPATVYLRGILMNIARELGLDPLKVSRSYLALAAGANTAKKR
jgi:hypothetical protein